MSALPGCGCGWADVIAWVGDIGYSKTGENVNRQVGTAQTIRVRRGGEGKRVCVRAYKRQ